MAKVELISIMDAVHGKMDKYGRVIMRQKKYRASNGAVLQEGVQETYVIKHPRDFDTTPPKGAELQNMRAFGDASSLAAQIIRSGKYTQEELADMTPEERTHVIELRLKLEDFRTRFYAQFKRPDPQAPFEKASKPGTTKLCRKQYIKLDNFIQAIIREQHKSHN